MCEQRCAMVEFNALSTAGGQRSVLHTHEDFFPHVRSKGRQLRYLGSAGIFLQFTSGAVIGQVGAAGRQGQGWDCRSTLARAQVATHTYLHTYLHTYILTYIHTYIHNTYIQTYRHAYIHTYMHTYIIHTYLHTFTYIQTCTHTQSCPTSDYNKQ